MHPVVSMGVIVFSIFLASCNHRNSITRKRWEPSGGSALSSPRRTRVGAGKRSRDRQDAPPPLASARNRGRPQRTPGVPGDTRQ
jgi:hypothetical protein